MKCYEASQVMYTYLDGQLDSENLKFFLAHLSKCSLCQNELAEAEKIHKLITKVCSPVEPPIDFVDKVMSKIEMSNIAYLPQKPKFQWKKFLSESSRNLGRVASFAVLLIATGAIIFYNNILSPRLLLANHDSPAKVGIATVAKPGNIKGTIAGGTVKTEPNSGEQAGANTTVPKDPEESAAHNITDKNTNISQQNKPDKNTTKNNLNSQENNKVPDRTLNPDLNKDDTPNTTRLPGPIKMASNSPRVPSKSVTLNEVVADENLNNAKPKWTNNSEFVYLSNKGSEEGKYSIWLQDLNANEGKLLAANSVDNIVKENPNTKSPDGSKTINIQDKQLIINDNKNNKKIAVTPVLNASNLVAAWSPEGDAVAININSPKGEERGLWIAKADGSTWTLGTSLGGGNTLSWSPDGKKIAFTDEKQNVYVLIPEKSVLYSVIPEGDATGPTAINWAPNSKKLLLDWVKPNAKARSIYLATIPE